MGDERTAACVAIGSELLGDWRVDTNSLAITQALARVGGTVVEKRVVGDDVQRIADAIRELLGVVDLVVLTGGLGPTADDVTREAVARALGRPLVHDPALLEGIRERYEEFGRPMPEIALAMAKVVAGSRVLANARGAAPGLLVEFGGGLVALLPGVPWEMEEMVSSELIPALERAGWRAVRARRTLLLSGVVESEVETRVRPLYERFGRERVTILASCGIVRLVFEVVGEETAAQAKLDEMEEAFTGVLGDDLAGVDVPGPEAAVLELLMRRGETLASAESCTGGLVGARLTEVPGASEVFLGGVVSYSNEVKQALLGVPSRLLEERGAVSEAVAVAMAEGARDRLGADWGIGITGVAGPGGGSEEKPVGLVHLAVAGGAGSAHRRYVFPGDRTAIRRWSSNMALDLLRRRAAATPEGGR